MKKKRMLCVIMAMLLSVIPIIHPMILYAETTNGVYPYTLFAASEEAGAITANASNFCVNGSVATNGTIAASGNFNVNGIQTEYAGENMIYILAKIEKQYFLGNNVNEIQEDYILEETNININQATEVNGDVSLTGNININNAFMAIGDILFDGDVKNSNNSVIFSKYGNIVINSQNVNLNGLVYAPFGEVVVTGQNLNLNSVIIIANKITFNCPNVNANTSNEMAKFVGNVSEIFHIPYSEWGYLPDSDGDGIPDFINDFSNWQYLIDTDGDWLPDCIEEYLGSDINLVDSDGDELPDGYEFFIVGTDQNVYDTLGEGLSDGEYDFDEDGLSNIKEYEIGTHPSEADCDSDCLTDGEEVNVYGTDPLKADSDGEGLPDGDEIVLGTSPFLQDTDGDAILDCDEKIMQEYTYETAKENMYIEEVKVTLNATGNVKKTTWIEGMRGMDPICEGVVGIVDEPFSIETESDFDTATISFKMNVDGLENKSVEDYIILWYDEENYTFVEMDTKYDIKNRILSTETTHFSRYMVVDKMEWFEAWNMDLNYADSDDENLNCYTVLAVDCSGSMKTYDPITTYLDSSNKYEVNDCKRYDAIRNYIFAMDKGDQTAIITFESSAVIKCELTDDKSTLYREAAQFYNYGGTNFNVALRESLNVLNNSTGEACKKIVLLSDGQSNADNSILEDIVAADIKVYTIGLGSSSYDAELQRIADVTGGEFFKAYTSDELEGIYGDISVGINTMDADGDNLYDVYEIIGIRLQNGTTIFTDPTDPDSDDDGLLDGEEINPEMIHNEVYYPTGVPLEKDYFVMVSDPNEEDGDFDGYSDPDEIAGVLKDDETRYEPSNPLISNVRSVEISNDYIKIDTPDNMDYMNYGYGGSQSWFYDENDPDKDDLTSFQLRKGGCGVIASCDNILYLQKFMGLNLTDVNTTEEYIPYEEYNEFVRQYSKDYLTPIDVQTPLMLTMKHAGYYPYEDFSETGIMLSNLITNSTGTWGCRVKDLNNSLKDYFTDNNYTDIEVETYDVLGIGQQEMEGIIWKSIESDIPVIMRSNYFSEIIATYGDGTESDEFQTHFFTITGIKVDSITGDTKLTISTWSHYGTIRFNYFFEESTFGSKIIIIKV